MLGITDEHRALHTAVRRWVENHASLSEARRALDASRAEVPGFWSALVDQHWLTLAISEHRGGEGFGLLELAVVAEELGRAAVPESFLPSALALLVADRGGGDDVMTDLLDGRPSAVALLTEGNSPPEAEHQSDGSIRVTAGQWSPVVGGAVAQSLLLPVSLDGESRWIVVDVNTSSTHPVEIQELPSFDPTRRAAAVSTAGFEVDSDRVIALAAADVGHLAAVVFGAEAVGLMAWCVETASAYAAEREQFGRPIGQFQAVKHRCADMQVELEACRALVWDAARLDRAQTDHAGGDPETFALAAEVVGVRVFDAAFRLAKDCIQVLGGIGFTWEHDAHLFLRRSASTLQLLGGSKRWSSRVASRVIAGQRLDHRVELPAEAETYRAEVRSFVDSVKSRPSIEWNPTIAAAGYLVPHWPIPYGLDAGPLQQLVIDDEFRAAGLRRAHLAVGMWVLPTLISHGTEPQQERFIGPTMRQEISWCQLFSEPGAGSDLASLATRADRADGGWLLTGQKVWTTLAHQAQWGICLARTSPEKPKHDGITCFLVEMNLPGIDIRPLRELTGDEMFNEVFLDSVFVPDDCVVGSIDNGWSAARTTLANERVSMGSGSSFGPGLEAVVELVRGRGDADPLTLDSLGVLLAEGQAVAALSLRMTLLALSGRDAGAEASVKKLLGVEHEQRVQELGLGLLGSDAVVNQGEGATWIHGFLGNRALSIAGGTSEVQRNVIAERILGLPKDP